MGINCAAMVHPIRGANLVDIEKRHAERQTCLIDAMSRPLEPGDGMGWGGTVTDISPGGLKLGLCFPFSPGTYLSVDLQSHTCAVGRSLVCRVVHVHDHMDGTWTLGCELLQPLAASTAELLV
jgi:hypothetical protein